MAKADSWNKVQNISLDVRLNWPASMPDGSAGFAPAIIRSNMQAISDTGGVRDIQRQTLIGTVRATIYTDAELGTIVKGSANSTGNALYTELAALYNEALGI